MSGDQLEMTWPTAAAIGDLLDADPSHARERDEVRRAMKADQAAHGHVNPNCVRSEVASWVGPRVLASQYGVLRRFTISKNGSLYLDRLRIVQTPWFGVYLHYIARPDLDRDPHDHPWNFGALVLRGGYTEEFHPLALVGRDLRVSRRRWDAFSWHTISRGQAHRIVSVKPRTYTLVFVGRRAGDWGFFTHDGWAPWRRYLAEQAESDTTASGRSRSWGAL